MGRIGIGIVGCGGIAKAKHIPSLLKDDRAEIVGICETGNVSSAEDAISSFNLRNCRLYTDFEEMLSDESIDAVHICTPNVSHARLSIEALGHGKNVMCEKPMASSVAEAEAMVEAADRSGKILTICSNNRFREDSWTLKQIIGQGMLGDIYYAEANYIRRRGVPTWGDFLNGKAQGGGPVIDIGTHALDLAMWLMDNHEPVSVFACCYDYLGKKTSQANPYGTWDSSDYKVEDFGVGLITMKNGASILLRASWLLNTRYVSEAKVRLCGTEAGADMDDGLTINGEVCGKLFDTTVMTDQKGINFYKVEKAYGPVLEIRKWLDCLENGGSPVVDPRHMLVVMRVIQAFYESAKTGKPVIL